ncbi:hypothetical protein C1S80_12695 [Mycolicibacterium aubagnense]|nr:hypothetical protein C1S80_12695 [Mycolicibacterium aubagnense]
MDTGRHLPAGTYHRCVTLHRFVQAPNAAAARRLAANGVQLTTGTLRAPDAYVVWIGAARPRIARYHHAGCADLWLVSTDVHALLRAAGPDTATEAAYLLVSVAEHATAADEFESEIQVLGEHGKAPRRIAA